ncbi:uncharacterized protein LOC110876551 [Helianthus annuus]|uniref:uncharacterized protein LOC110876551 n=1 Tax=Helianthus annuus TaxID=4232 RepID=UPI000B906285|nr:uncharacterized protein LOC110876551 [Helianthus annuus]
MSEGNDDDPVQTSSEQMKEMITEEVEKAIDGSLSGFIDKIQSTLLSLVEERVKRLEDSVNLMKEKSGERVFERTHCDESDFVAYGTGQLRGQAKDWWDNKKNEIGAEAAKTMTWEEFKTPFLKHHSPKAVINKIKEEFMQLRHKGETIDKITAMFMDKIKFSSELVTNEEQKIYYYYDMLSAEYREFMTPSKYETLTEIINVAREREIELKKQVERGEQRAQDVNPSPTKKARTGESGKKVDAKGGSPSCKLCGKGHKGECRFKDKSCPICSKTGHTVSLCPGKVSVCYKYYQPGHKKSECPELVGKRDTKESPTEAPKAKARSFQLTAAEAKTEPDVVSEVEIGDNKSFIVCDICRGCKLNIDDEEYLIDLIPMSMGEFQIVVGMDWLSQHHAKIVCFRKEIKLTSPSGKHVTIYGEKGGNPTICSMIKAHKLIRHGCKAFMIYANEPEKELPKIGDVPVVRDFEDVFPDDLPGMPPEREVEKADYVPIRVRSMQLVVTSGILERIREAQVEAVKEENWKKERIIGQLKDLSDGKNGLKTRSGRIWVPNTCGVKALLLNEAHKS